jgi:hypothetical protein
VRRRHGRNQRPGNNRIDRITSVGQNAPADFLGGRFADHVSMGAHRALGGERPART